MLPRPALPTALPTALRGPQRHGPTLPAELPHRDSAGLRRGGLARRGLLLARDGGGHCLAAPLLPKAPPQTQTTASPGPALCLQPRPVPPPPSRPGGRRPAGSACYPSQASGCPFEARGPGSGAPFCSGAAAPKGELPHQMPARPRAEPVRGPRLEGPGHTRGIVDAKTRMPRGLAPRTLGLRVPQAEGAPCSPEPPHPGLLGCPHARHGLFQLEAGHPLGSGRACAHASVSAQGAAAEPA